MKSNYGFQLHTQEIKDIEDWGERRAVVTYVGERVAVNIYWHFSGAAAGVFFTELLRPHEVPLRGALMSSLPGAAREIRLYTLAEMLGHAQDADFLLGDTWQVKERDFERRNALLRSNMSGVLEGSARATERYASDILRGDTRDFPEVMRFYEQKLRAKGYRIPQ